MTFPPPDPAVAPPAEPASRAPHGRPATSGQSASATTVGSGAPLPASSALASTPSQAGPTGRKRPGQSTVTARTGAPNLPDPLGDNVVGERSVVPPIQQGKSRTALTNELNAEPVAGTVPAAPGGDLFIDAVLAQSYRHFFGPTSQPAVPPRQQVISITRLMEKLVYLKPADQALVREAFQFSDEAHLGQYRQSGEPYITHPVAAVSYTHLTLPTNREV